MTNRPISGTKKTDLRIGGDSAESETRERARHETRSSHKGDERELKPHGAGLYPVHSVIVAEVAAVCTRRDEGCGRKSVCKYREGRDKNE